MHADVLYDNWNTGARWVLAIPLNSVEQVDVLRRDFRGRIEQSLSDRSLIGSEIERVMGSSVFEYERLSDVLDTASADIQHNGRIINETERNVRILSLKDTDRMAKLYERFFSVETVGEFATKPL